MLKVANMSGRGRTVTRMWVQGISDTSILSIAELTCHEPNCPPIETIITERAMDGKVRNWRIGKPINEVLESDIVNLTDSHNHSH